MNNSALRQLYVRHFSERKLSREAGEKCSLPLLMNMPAEDAWQNNRRRILFVGQESLNCWGEDVYNKLFDTADTPQFIDALMGKYKDFNFSAGNHRYANSPFWRTFRQLGDPAKGEILWSNIFKFDYKGGAVLRRKDDPAPTSEIYRAQNTLLSEEIRLLQPTAIIFFTGPFYDEAIISEFPDVKIEAFGPEKVRAFAKLSSAQLTMPAFRLYHPNYLSRKKRLDVVIKTLKSNT